MKEQNVNMVGLNRRAITPRENIENFYLMEVIRASPTPYFVGYELADLGRLCIYGLVSGSWTKVIPQDASMPWFENVVYYNEGFYFVGSSGDLYRNNGTGWQQQCSEYTKSAGPQQFSGYPDSPHTRVEYRSQIIIKRTSDEVERLYVTQAVGFVLSNDELYLYADTTSFVTLRYDLIAGEWVYIETIPSFSGINPIAQYGPSPPYFSAYDSMIESGTTVRKGTDTFKAKTTTVEQDNLAIVGSFFSTLAIYNDNLYAGAQPSSGGYPRVYLYIEGEPYWAWIATSIDRHADSMIMAGDNGLYSFGDFAMINRYTPETETWVQYPMNHNYSQRGRLSYVNGNICYLFNLQYDVKLATLIAGEVVLSNSYFGLQYGQYVYGVEGEVFAEIEGVICEVVANSLTPVASVNQLQDTGAFVRAYRQIIDIDGDPVLVSTYYEGDPPVAIHTLLFNFLINISPSESPKKRINI